MLLNLSASSVVFFPMLLDRNINRFLLDGVLLAVEEVVFLLDGVLGLFKSVCNLSERVR